MIYRTRPAKFSPKFEVVSCFIELNKEILLLHRQDHKPEGNTWGIPAGKVDFEETPITSIVREIREETGNELPPFTLSYLGRLFVRYPSYDFIYHTYQTRLIRKPEIVISQSEHKRFMWTSLKDSLNLPLIRDLDACIRLFYKI